MPRLPVLWAEMPEHAKRTIVAVAVFAATLVARFLLDQVLPPGLPFLTFFLAVIANSYIAGTAMGLITLIASAALAGPLWLYPTHILPPDPASTLAIIAFLVVGGLNIAIVHLLRDQQSRSQELAASKELTEIRLRTALGAASMGTWEYDLVSGKIAWDGPLRELMGLATGQQPSMDFFFSIVHPDDRARLQGLQKLALAGDVRALRSEFRIVLQDGSIRWLQIEGAYLPGLHLRAAGIARDITRRKLADEQLQLINRELQHRLRNLFTIVGAMFQQTLRASGIPEAVNSSVQGRLLALATAQDLLREQSRGIDLALLVERVAGPLAPVATSTDRRFSIAGPAIRVPPENATGFALVLHELATNALKHGAWSTAEGSIDIDWTLRDGRLDFHWREIGGPAPVPNVRQGLGTALINSALSGATVHHNISSSGVDCIISMPIGETQ